MENPKISIFDSGTIEIRGGKGSSVKRCGVLVSAFATDADKVSILVNTSVTNVLGSLRLSFLIEKDDGIKMRLSPVIPYPPLTRMVGILKVTSERGCEVDRFGGGSGSGNGGLVLSKSYRLITINAVVAHVWFSEV